MLKKSIDKVKNWLNENKNNSQPIHIIFTKDDEYLESCIDKNRKNNELTEDDYKNNLENALEKLESVIEKKSESFNDRRVYVDWISLRYKALEINPLLKAAKDLSNAEVVSCLTFDKLYNVVLINQDF